MHKLHGLTAVDGDSVTGVWAFCRRCVPSGGATEGGGSAHEKTYKALRKVAAVVGYSDQFLLFVRNVCRKSIR